MYPQLNRTLLRCDVIPDGKNWVNCAILTGNSASLRTVLSSRLSHTLRSSFRESQRFLSLPADTMMASSQGTSVSSNPFSRSASHDIFLTTSYSTIYAFFSSFRITLWPMWLANSKRQPCFYPPQSHAQDDTQNWQKNWQTWWETCVMPENIQFTWCVFVRASLHMRAKSLCLDTVPAALLLTSDNQQLSTTHHRR